MSSSESGVAEAASDTRGSQSSRRKAMSTVSTPQELLLPTVDARYTLNGTTINGACTSPTLPLLLFDPEHLTPVQHLRLLARRFSLEVSHTLLFAILPLLLLSLLLLFLLIFGASFSFPLAGIFNNRNPFSILFQFNYSYSGCHVSDQF